MAYDYLGYLELVCSQTPLFCDVNHDMRCQAFLYITHFIYCTNLVVESAILEYANLTQVWKYTVTDSKYQVSMLTYVIELFTKKKEDIF